MAPVIAAHSPTHCTGYACCRLDDHAVRFIFRAQNKRRRETEKRRTGPRLFCAQSQHGHQLVQTNCDPYLSVATWVRQDGIGQPMYVRHKYFRVERHALGSPLPLQPSLKALKRIFAFRLPNVSFCMLRQRRRSVYLFSYALKAFRAINRNIRQQHRGCYAVR